LRKTNRFFEEPIRYKKRHSFHPTITYNKTSERKDKKYINRHLRLRKIKDGVEKGNSSAIKNPHLYIQILDNISGVIAEKKA